MNEMTAIPACPEERALADTWTKIKCDLMRVLQDAVPDCDDVAYLDYPVHTNIGDALIYLGTDRWLASRRGAVVGRWHIDNFSFPRLPETTTLLWHGGGNFGDIYRHQRFREHVIRRYEKNRIVVLPQSMCYSNKAAITSSARILEGHPQLHLLWREQRSLQIATNAFKNARHWLAPDMASLLFPVSESLEIDAARRLNTEVLYLLRKDKEIDPTAEIPNCGNGPHNDWRDLAANRIRWMRAWQILAFGLGRVLPHTRFESSWREVARRSAEYCARRFLDAKVVVTSRLHGHILACLLGIPNVVVDNRFGKCSSYLRTWHGDFDFVRLASVAKPLFKCDKQSD